VFWWYWSLRRRLLLLAVVALPVVAFFGLRAVGGSGGTSRDAVPVPSSIPDQAAGDGVSGPGVSSSAALADDMLVLRSDDARSASSRFPGAFSSFPESVQVATNLVLPGVADDEYSFYALFLVVDGAVPTGGQEGNLGASTTVPPTTVVSPVTSVPVMDPDAPPLERVLGTVRSHFYDLDAIVREIDTIGGVELSVAGLDAGRGYRTVLRFLEVPQGVVFYGKVAELAPNEINDMKEAEAAARIRPPVDTSGGTAIPSTVPGSTVAPAVPEDAAGVSTTVPGASPTTVVVAPSTTVPGASPTTVVVAPSTTVVRAPVTTVR